MAIQGDGVLADKIITTQKTDMLNTKGTQSIKIKIFTTKVDWVEKQWGV